MTIESEITGLTQATTNLLNAVNVSKANLDQKVADAAAQADLATSNGATQVNLAAQQASIATAKAAVATTKASEATGAAASALAIYGSAAAQQAAVLQAASSAASAASYASRAQAVSPDSPIRLNTRNVVEDFSVPPDYNAASTGPLAISDGVTVTVSDHSTWSIQ